MKRWSTSLQRITLLTGLAASLTHGQEVTASLSGLVRDASGAVIVGAMVQAREVETNTLRTAVTNEAGYYEMRFLRPGTYTLSVSQPGFKTYERSGIRLEVAQRASIDVVLEVGVATERIEVRASVPVVQLEDPSIGKVMDFDTIVNTPLNSRLNMSSLLALAPGIQSPGTQDAIPNYGITPRLNGASSYGALAYTLDGVTNVSFNISRAYGEIPPLDGIREFKVITSGANAEFGQPNQVIVVTRGGTNQLHGTALAFNRNRFLAAKNFFATHLPLPQYNRNEFGGNISGPVVLPSIYNGKDRTFFFANWEGFRRNQATTLSSQMPTVEQRNGDFSAFPAIRDPFNGGLPFPGNQIPRSRFNRVTQEILKLYPLPNRPGTGTNLIENVGIAEKVTRASFRVDHTLSPSHQLSGTLMAGLLGPNPSVGATSKFGGMAELGEHNYHSTLAWTGILNPSTVNELRLGFQRLRIFRTPQGYKHDPAAYIPGLPPQDIGGPPTVTITNITRISEAGSRDIARTIQVTNNLSKTFGTHSFKAGFTFLRGYHWNLAATSPQRGHFSFNGQYSGNGFADFMLGYPNFTQLPIPSATDSRLIQRRYFFFAQDEWKATPRLTVSYGLRYELINGVPNAAGRNAMFVPSVGKVVVFAEEYPKGTVSLLVDAFKPPLARTVGLPTDVWAYIGQDHNNFAPRLGLAYKFSSRTVVRSAFGMYYANLGSGTVSSGLYQNIPFSVAVTYEQPTGPVPGFTMDNPFGGTATIPANPTAYVLHKYVTPYTLQWNFTIERELPQAVGLRISYVGARNVKQTAAHVGGPGLTITPDLNAVRPAPGAVQPRRFYQPYANIWVNNSPLFQSNLNTLQVGAQKRLSHGWLLNAEYQYVRVLGTEGFMDQFNWNDSRGNMNGIRTHVLAASYSYEFPFGRGKPILGSAGPVLNRLVSGWVLSGITMIMSGAPFSVTCTTSVQGSVCGRPDVIAGAPLYPARKTIARWFNPAAFRMPPDFTYGNSAYNMLWGPGQQNWDASLAKNTALGERVNLQLRLDAFGAFNNPQFSNPNANISNPATVGTITSATGNRTMQIGAKLRF